MTGTNNKYLAPLTMRPPTWQSAGLLPPWEEVEHLAPSQAEILEVFGRKQPPPTFVDSIRYFIGCSKHPVIAEKRHQQMKFSDDVAASLRNIKSAVRKFEKSTIKIESLPRFIKSSIFDENVEAFARRLRNELLFLLEFIPPQPFDFLSPHPHEKEWRILAQQALFFVVDPAVQAAKLNFRATSAESVRVRLLSYVVRSCGVPDTEASAAAIREWLKAKEMPVSPFLSFRRTGT